MRINRVFTSIKWRFILIYLVVVVLAFGLTTLITATIIENKLIQRRISECMQSVNELSSSVVQDLLSQNAANLYRFSVEQSNALEGRVLIVDRYGIVQIDSFSRLNSTYLSKNKEVVEVLAGNQEASYGFHKIEQANEKTWTGYYVSAVIENGEIIGAVLLSQSIQDVVNETDAIKRQYILIYAICTVIIILILYFFTDRVVEPLKSLRENVLALSGGDFSKRVEVRGADEVANLGRSFNLMAVRLENIDRQRNEFVSNASHELKTPLTSAKILLESLLYQEDIPEEIYKEFLGEINVEVDRMTDLINDLLLLTKMQSVEEGEKKDVVDVDHLVNEALESVYAIAAEKDIEMIFEPDVHQSLRAFSTYLRQAVRNLIENAVKYTEEGGQVIVHTYESGNDVCISVEDTGEGIPTSEFENIFERFYRIDKARARETGGTGLGLYMVRTTAIMHNGRIEVESELGKGSTFTLILPIRGQATEADA